MGGKRDRMDGWMDGWVVGERRTYLDGCIEFLANWVGGWVGG